VPVGLAVWLLGLALAVWAWLYIGRNWGTPMRTWPPAEYPGYKRHSKMLIPSPLQGPARERARPQAQPVRLRSHAAAGKRHPRGGRRPPRRSL